MKTLDDVFNEFSEQLQEYLPWLENCFGIVKSVKRDGHEEPVLLSHKNEYVSVFPDTRLGNYSFFDIESTQTFVSWNKGRAPILKVPFSLILWYDLSNIEGHERSVEQIKREVSTAMWQKITLRLSSFRLTGISTDANRIFGKFYRTGMETKYLMHPYGAMKFSGNVYFSERD